jgi:hypothetical protein
MQEFIMKKCIFVAILFGLRLSNAMEQISPNAASEKKTQSPKEDRCDIICFENKYNDDLEIYISDSARQNLTNFVRDGDSISGKTHKYPDGGIRLYGSNYPPYSWFRLKPNKSAYIAFFSDIEEHSKICWPITIEVTDKGVALILNGGFVNKYIYAQDLAYSMNARYQFNKDKSGIVYSQTINKKPMYYESDIKIIAASIIVNEINSAHL